jgi:hypothetical protein
VLFDSRSCHVSGSVESWFKSKKPLLAIGASHFLQKGIWPDVPFLLPKIRSKNLGTSIIPNASEKGNTLVMEPFIMLPVSVAFDPTLSPKARLLWAALEDHSGEHKTCWPGYTALAKKVGCSVRWLPVLVKELVNAGLLLAEYRQGKSNRYTLLQRIPRPPKPTHAPTAAQPMKPTSYKQKQPTKTNKKGGQPPSSGNIDFKKYLSGGSYGFLGAITG